MAKDPDIEQEIQHQSRHRNAIREVLGDVAKEMGFAIQDTRNELIDRAWFDRDRPREQEGWDYFKGGEKELTTSDVYGRDPFASPEPDWERERDSALDRERGPADDMWAQEKAMAEKEFGHGPDTRVSDAGHDMPGSRELTTEDVYGRNPFAEREFDHGLDDMNRDDREMDR